MFQKRYKILSCKKVSPAKLRHYEFGWISLKSVTALMPIIVSTTSKIRVMGICAIWNCVRQGINVTDAAVLNRGLFRTQKILFHLLMVKCSMIDDGSKAIPSWENQPNSWYHYSCRENLTYVSKVPTYICW